MGSELLSGFRMLDLADEKGALCGKIFADMGADVIKVEPPQGCPTRRMPPFVDDLPDAERSLYFIAYQAGKRSVTLNLDSPDGRALLEDLVRKSDFLLESFPVGYMESIGLGYERLAELNPRIIHTSITPFGDTGPGKQLQGRRHRLVGLGRPDVPDGRGGQAAAGDEPAAGRTARRRRGRGRLAARALPARDRRARASTSWSTCRPASCGR